MLVRAAGNNSNLLLNIGPMPNGEIQEEFATRLRTVGEWLSHYGEAIYGTRGGPFEPTDQKTDKVYLHVLKWNAPLLALPPLQSTIRTAQLLPNGSPIEFTQTSDGVVLKLPPAAAGEIDRVIVLALETKK